MKKIWGGLLALCLTATAWAQADSTSLFEDQPVTATADQPTAPEQAAANDEFKLNLSGTHFFRFAQPVHPDAWNYNSPAKAPLFSNEGGLIVQNDDLKLTSLWAVDAAVTGADTLLTADKLTRWSLRPLENYLAWSPGAFKWSAGWQIYSWGAADGKNPTDNLNAQDYSQGLDSPKIPAFSLATTWYATEDLSLEAVYVPVTQSAIFPVNVAGQLPSALFYGLDLSPTGTPVPQVFARNITQPALNFDPSSFTAGGRLRAKLAGVDLSASYLWGWDTFSTPVLKLEADPIMMGTTPTGATYYRVQEISLQRLRVQHLGFDIKTTLDRFGVWTEADLMLTTDPWADSFNIRHPKLSWVSGFDVSFGPSDLYYLNLQYLGEYVFLYDTSFGSDYKAGHPDSTQVGNRAYMEKFYYRALTQSLGSQTEGLLQGVSFDLKIPTEDSFFTAELRGAYTFPFFYDESAETRFGSLAISPQIDLMPQDSFHIFIGANLAYSWIKDTAGTVKLKIEGDNMGTYTPDNNVYIKVQYKWTTDLKK